MSQEELSSFQAVGALTNLHANASPVLLAVDVNPRNSDQFVTAGVDKTLQVHSHSSEFTAAAVTLKSHTKQVNDVVWHTTQDVLFSASADKTIKLWTETTGGKYKATATIKSHGDSVTGLALHPSGDYLLSAGADGKWAFHDVAEAKTVFSVDGDSAYSAIEYHPDGLIFASGSQDTGVVKIWDVRTQAVAFECPELHVGNASALAFSENGYYFAAAGDADSVVKIWDLRKLTKLCDLDVGSGKVNALRFDYSGQYLAAVGADLR